MLGFMVGVVVLLVKFMLGSGGILVIFLVKFVRLILMLCCLWICMRC